MRHISFEELIFTEKQLWPACHPLHRQIFVPDSGFSFTKTAEDGNISSSDCNFSVFHNQLTSVQHP